MDRINELKDLINHYDHMYYDCNVSEITDEQYDILMRELIELEKINPDLITLDSPTQRIGGTVSDGFIVVNHKWPMLSIDNCFSYDELREFDQRVTKVAGSSDHSGYIAELKLDGLAISLQYEKGILTRAVTRGDGTRGDDVTNNVKLLRTVPLSLKGEFPDYLEVRGEVTMDKAELNRLNDIRVINGEKLLANCRNAAAGSLKQLDSKEFKNRKLKVTVFDMYPQLPTRSEIIYGLAKMGFHVNTNSRQLKTIDDVIKYCESYSTVKRDLPYDVDGIVVKVNDITICQKMGFTGHAPRAIIAYKFPAEVVSTRLLGITVQVGKSGILTPVAELEPVKLCGTIVKRASLYNFEQLYAKDLRIGDMIRVQKAGEIVPQVIGKIDSERPEGTNPFPLPTSCPICGSTVAKDPDGVFIRCTSTSCQAQLAERIIDFAGKPAMDIDGVGSSLIMQLIEAGLVTRASDLYKLEPFHLAELERMGDRKIENIQNAILESKKQPFERVLIALSIPNVGKHLSPLLAKTFKSMDGLAAATVDQLKNLPDVGEIVANCIVDWFANNDNKLLVQELKDYGLAMTYVPKITSGPKPLAGKKLLATGKLVNYTRDSIDQRIIDAGGEVASSVSKDVDYLIVGDKAGSKLQKAQNLGVTILTEDEFRTMIADNIFE